MNIFLVGFSFLFQSVGGKDRLPKAATILWGISLSGEGRMKGSIYGAFSVCAAI